MTASLTLIIENGYREMAQEKRTITVRFTEEEVQMIQEICDKSFMTRCSVLKKAFYLLYESVKKSEKERKARGENAGA